MTDLTFGGWANRLVFKTGELNYGKILFHSPQNIEGVEGVLLLVSYLGYEFIIHHRIKWNFSHTPLCLKWYRGRGLTCGGVRL